MMEQTQVFVDDASKIQNMQLVYSYCGNIVKQFSCNMCIVFLAFVNFSLALFH